MPEYDSTIQYRDIPGFPGYKVCDDGSVWSCWRKVGLGRWHGSRYVIGDVWTQKRPGHSKKQGHETVSLTRNGGLHSKWVHRLVLEAFIGPCPEKMECCHYDGNPRNNRLDNLRWDTKKNNCADAIRHGRTTRGDRNARAKLTRDDVIEIRQRYANGETQGAIAKSKLVSQATIWRIVRHKCWSHV